MRRFSWRGPNVPPRHYEFETSLPEAKHRGWAHVAGERRPPASPRRHHRGFLEDLPLPEGPIRPRRAGPGEAFGALARALGLGGCTMALWAPDAAPAEGGAVAGPYPVEPAGSRRATASEPAETAAEPLLPSAA
jgi:hypothetical protein